jgi:hypothetical protein
MKISFSRSAWVLTVYTWLLALDSFGKSAWSSPNYLAGLKEEDFGFNNLVAI